MIQLIDVHKSLGNKKILNGLTLSVEKGETFVIIGGSGEGKSVTLKHIIGLLQPDSGKVIVTGMDISTGNLRVLAEVRKRFGVLLQSGALLQSLTAGENVALPLREHTDLSEPKIQKIVREKLSLVNLTGAENVMPSNLSGGMKKRVALARAMALDPEVLFCDEPSAGLDPVTAASLDELILNLRDRFGMAIVVVTHELASIETIADQVTMLGAGRVLAQGPYSEVQGLNHPEVRAFFDRQGTAGLESRMSLLDALQRNES